MVAVRENLLKLYRSAADETIIDQVLWHGTASLSERYLTAMAMWQAFSAACGSMSMARN